MKPWSGGRIRIGASTPKKWNPLSPIIRRLLKVPYSHVWLLLDDALFDVDMVLEAGEHGVELVPYDRFVVKNQVVCIFDPHPDYQLDIGLRSMVRDIGTPFDRIGLVGMAFVLLFRWLRRKVRNPFASARAMFCSEVVALVLKRSKVPEAISLDPEATDPHQVIAVLEKMRQLPSQASTR